MKKGKVYLVGAGPSDIGLLTIKGKKAIEEADIVLYDKLVSHSVISLAKDDATLIDVGKRANNHTMEQDEINKLLLKYALEGRNIVRLKGGDPFLFGRGGEELELLIENDIPFEVISGVTSAVAVLTHAGIPITHRDFASSVHIITGHKKANKEQDIDFNALVKLKGTLVFLMGISSLGFIVDGLLNGGMDRSMPVCILEKGTTAKERTIKGTISNICEKAQEKQVQTPAIIVVGEVCSLADKFNFKKFLPLAKKRVLVTRPKNLNSKLCTKLRENGAEVIEIPAIKTEPIENENIKNILDEIQKYNYLVFTSPTGVNYFFDILKENRLDIRRLAKIKIAALGKSTKREIEERGLFADIMPEIYTSENLAKELLKNVSENEKILLARAKEGSSEIVKVFENKNVYIEDLAIYETIYEPFEFINFEFDYEDLVTFTSASTVRGFINSLKSYNLDYSKINAICIGEETEKEAKKYNMKTKVSKEATIDSLLKKVIEVTEVK